MFPGQIISGEGDTYLVNIYRKGVDGEAEEVEAYQLDISESESIPEESWVFVNQITVEVEDEEEPTTQYYIQAPIWM